MTKIVKCNCQHGYQDELYGSGNRAANETRSGQLRCVVCGTLHGSATTVVAKPTKADPVAKKEPVKKTAEKKNPVNNDKKPSKKSLKGGKR